MVPLHQWYDLFLYSARPIDQFWSSAFFHAVYLKNRHWHSTFVLTPYEAWSINVANVLSSESLCCICHSLNTRKLAPRTFLKLFSWSISTPNRNYWRILVKVSRLMLTALHKMREREQTIQRPKSKGNKIVDE